MKRFETIVLGLGAMGSATAWQLARRGNSVLGIDRFTPPHEHGSTHGDTRITRLAIGEGAQYTPLAMRSHEIWRELERETGSTLLVAHGGLVLSSKARTSQCHTDEFFANTVAAAEKHDIAHEILDAGQIRRRFPQFRIADDESGYFEPGAGFVRPEECVRVQLALAAQCGAQLHRGEVATAFDASDSGVTVTTDRDTYSADTLIVTAGPWLPGLVATSLSRHFTIYRQLLCWFDIDGPLDPFLPVNFPVFIWELQGRPQGIYGFPAIDGARGGLKVATESYVAPTTAESVERRVSDAEVRAVYDDYVAPLHFRAEQPMRESRDMPVHGHAGFRLRHRRASRRRPGHRRVAVLRSRLQAFGGDRRGAGAARDGWRERHRLARLLAGAFRRMKLVAMRQVPMY